MGFAFQPNSQKDDGSDMNPGITGEVIYRKRHIRLHNRFLKMKHHKPKHIYFDDDGNEIKTNIDNNEVKTVLHSSSDDDSNTNVPIRKINTNKLMESSLTFKSIENDEENHSLIDGELDGGCLDDDIAIEMPIASGSVKKEKKKRRKAKLISARLPSEILNDKSLIKYWYKRFSLFSKFDNGIKLDKGELKKIYEFILYVCQ